jgi:putative alpha-1,2-mannosidase
MFEIAIIHLPNGKEQIIKTINNSAENKYVQSLTFTGKLL